MVRNVWTLSLGFFLVVLGITSLLLNMTGMQYVFLSFLQALPPLLNFLLHLVMIFGGMILAYMSTTYGIPNDRDE